MTQNGNSLPAIHTAAVGQVIDMSGLILRSMRDAVILTDLDGVVTYWNDAATRMFGWSTEEMLGRPYADRFPAEQRAWITAQIRARVSGVDWDSDYEDQRKDGTKIWIRAHVRLIHGPDGRPAGILGVSQHLFDNRQDDKAAHARETLERAVLDSLPAHIAVLDQDGVIRTVNRAWRHFASEQAPAGTLMAPNTDIGINYLQMCRSATSDGIDHGSQAGVGIRDVLCGRCSSFEMEYPCHGPAKQRWFRMTVTPLGHAAGGAVVAHSDITDRILSEENSRQQSERLQLALAAAQMGVWGFDVKTQEVTWSPEVEQILQRANFQLQPSAVREVLNPEDAAQMDEKMARCIAERGRFEGSFRLHHPDGTVRWLHNFAQVRLGRSGESEQVVGTVQDITEARAARMAMLWQNRVLQQIVGGAPLSAVLDDVARLIEDQLPGTLCSILLRERDSSRLRSGAAPSLPAIYNAAVDGIPIGAENGACGRSAFYQQVVFVRDVTQDPLFAQFRELVMSQGLRSCISVPILSGDPGRQGADRVLGTFALYRRGTEDPSGSFAAFAAAASTDQLASQLGAGRRLRDLSADETSPAAAVQRALANAVYLAGLAIERHTVRQEIHDSEERFRLLVDGVTDYAVFLVDTARRVRTWNSGAMRTFGYSVAEAIGLSTDCFRTKEERGTGAADPHRQKLAAEGRVEFDGWRVRKDGTQFWATTTVSELRDESGTLRGYAVLIRDLTEKRRLEEQLRQSQKMDAIGRLAGGVAHDFNNMLMIINGYAEQLLEALSDDPPLTEVALSIRDAGQRAAALTSQLLAFGRKAIVEPKLLDLSKVVSAAGPMLQRLLGEDIQLCIQVGPSLGRVKLDPGQLDQIVMNLVANARDAMPQGGQLHIKTAAIVVDASTPAELAQLPAQRYVELSISDTGAGIPESIRAHIFEPFFTTKGVGHGTGLGLATVYGIVRQAGGGVFVDSPPGEGTTFRILLPVADERLASTATPAVVAPRGSETILVVEDEEGVRDIVRLSLERIGYQVLAAGSSQAALSLAAAHAEPIQLLLTDVVMPETGGRALAEALLAQRPELKVLFMSGYTDDAVVRHGVEAAMVAFLQKPFSPRVLANKVRELLDS